MIFYRQILKTCVVLLFVMFVSSCGSDVVEDVIQKYKTGNKKVYVRYHPDPNVLEKHFYNSAGEMIHLERDSLSYSDDFKHFMIGTWVIEKMVVDDEVMFEKDSILNLDSLPNVYEFTSSQLLVTGPQYKAEYNIQFLDSTGLELEGWWTYGSEGEDTYRTERIYDIDYFDILSYYSFIWSEFLEDEEKEEKVIFRRITVPHITIFDSTIVDSNIINLDSLSIK